MEERETLSSQLGFLLLSVGCAVGLGNVWRFPYVTGKYGGGVFVLLYVCFLLLIGLPLLIAELAIGRAAGKTLAVCPEVLTGRGKCWKGLFLLAFSGNLLLMMYYTVVTGWLLATAKAFSDGSIMSGRPPAEFFSSLIASPGECTFYTALAIGLSALVCGIGLRKGVEQSVKGLMIVLFLLIGLLAGRSLFLPGAAEGMKFYLKPELAKFTADPGGTLHAAMGQAFFTLSLGVGAIAVFGSYASKARALAGESVTIILLDTVIALLAGVIIFPCCFSFGADPGAGPGLIFISLSDTFRVMAGGRWWGALFFVFLSIAALTTVIAVFENMITFLIDLGHMRRRTAAALTGTVTFVLSLPCILGYSLWSGFQPFGKGSSVLDLVDFIVSQNLLPLGALSMALFCSLRYGWGWENFVAEANTGKGLKLPAALGWYFRFVLPLLVAAVMFFGYCQTFK